MKTIQRDGIVLELIEALRKEGSWCGETHIQKASYFLKEMAEIQFDFPFILYKHGPYSFDLSDELAMMRADSLIGWEERHESYGASFYVTEVGERFKDRIPKTLGKYRPSILFVARKFGDRGVRYLEKISTALYVTKEADSRDKKARAERITEIKPHISLKDAEDAVMFVDEMIAEYAALKLPDTEA